MQLRHSIAPELKRCFLQPHFWKVAAVGQFLLGCLFYHLTEGFARVTQAQLLAQKSNFGITEEVLHPYFGWSALLGWILIPLLTMYSFSGERKQHTLVLYRLSALSAFTVVLSKYLSLNIVLLFVILGLMIAPVSLLSLGTLDLGQVGSSVLGVYLFLSTILALGLAASSFVKQPFLAGFICFIGVLLLSLLEWQSAHFSFSFFLRSFSFLYHFKPFLNGIVASQDVLFFIGFSVFCLLLATWRLDREALFP